MILATCNQIHSMMKRFLLSIHFLVVFLLISPYAQANDLFGGYLSGKANIGQFGGSPAALGDRFVGLASIDSLLGFNFRGATYGLHLQYDLVGQITPLAEVGRTNSKGNISSVGVGIRYFWNDDYHITGILDLVGDYVFTEKTIGAENDKVNKPLTLRVIVGKRLDLPYLVTVDGIFNYSNYSNFHIGGRDYDWDSRLWSVGLGLTWHFGKAAKYVPSADTASVVAQPQSVALAQEVVSALPSPSISPILEANSPLANQAGDNRERIRSKYIFSANRYRIGANMVSEIKAIAARIKANPDMRVEVEGYSDTSGLEQFNTSLSQARAESVRNYLIKLDIEPERILAVGKSDLNPISGNETKEGRANNRRYEIILITKGGAQ